ncbi:MAG: hypothetical protein IIU24_07625 [Selenomonas sp.]|nr:hypothetical protein [Selenomonas sp.]
MQRNRKWRKWLGSMLAAGLLLGGITAAEAAVVTGSFDSRVYENRLDKFSTMRVYNVEGEKDVPYVSVQEYLTALYYGDVAFQVNAAGSGLTAVRNNTQVEFDVQKGSLRCPDWDAFFGSYGDRALPNGILHGDEFNAMAVSRKHQSTETEAKSFSIDLANYGLQMVSYEGKVLVPFAVLQNVFAVPLLERLYSFNGDHFYAIQESIGYIYGHNLNSDIQLNPYANAYYSGKFSREKEIPPGYARYAYGSTCLLFDLYYGHKQEKGIKNFDSYLAQNGLKEGMLSTDNERNSEAFLDLIYKLFNSPHDAVVLSHSVFDTADYINMMKAVTAYGGLEPTAKALQKLCYKLADRGVNFSTGETGTYDQYQSVCQELQLNPVLLTYIFRDASGQPHKSWLDMAKKFMNIRGTEQESLTLETFPGQDRSEDTNKWSDSKYRIKTLKPDNFGTSRVDIIDDTAFIYFEGFEESLQEGSYYYCLPDEETYDKSTFGLFYDAFAKIKKNPQVKKVVIDLSNNQGGAIGAMAASLGFLSADGEVNLTYAHTLNQNYCSEWYHVDTNLDGKFDDNDGFGGQYDFYIITNPYSYSCANAMAFYAQMSGLAKVIGEQPGGGDCAVAPFLDAYGHVAAMSGWLKFSRMVNGSVVSDEHAVKVDYPFGEQADKMYFNYEKIAQWLKDKK